MADLEGVTLKNNYFLRKKLGRGGMADVYQAWDQARSAPVAIKTLRSDRQDEREWRAALLQEADWLGQLKHPYIVPCYGLERSGEIEFLVMDWVDGHDLRQEIDSRRRPFTPAEAVEILKPVCSALSFTHQKNIFHCDIKPANILISNKGEVLLTDFSVAQPGSSGKTSGGTPVYMAPEQITGSPVSAQTDIYGLGITLYEMLSGGRLPFRGDSWQSDPHGDTPRQRVEWEQCNLPPPELHSENPLISPAVEGVVARALEKPPERRHPGALAFLNDLIQTQAAAANAPPDELLTTRHIGPAQPAAPLAAAIVSPPPGASVRRPPGAASPGAQPVGPYLLGRSPTVLGQCFVLSGERAAIGRASTCQVVISDPQISRCHATLILGRRAVYLVDENSKAGTFLNGAQLPPQSPRALKDGDLIQLGSWAFEFHYR